MSHPYKSIAYLIQYGLNPDNYIVLKELKFSNVKDLLSEINEPDDYVHHLKLTENKSQEEIDQYLEEFPVKEFGVSIIVINGSVLNKNLLIRSLLKKDEILVRFLKEIDADDETTKIEKMIFSHLISSPSHVSREEFAKILLIKFPDYSYAGTAYRAVGFEGENKFDPKKVIPGTSWSLSPEGRENFVDISPFYEVTYLEGNIIGVSLIRLLKEKFPHFLNEGVIHPKYFKEDEIIATEIINFEVKK